MAEALHGSCACHRNQYTIFLPSTRDERQLAQVYFDNSAANRRLLASPVTAWLRVPISWYHSSTYGHYNDETASSIKRVFYSPSISDSLPETRHQFCGFCSTNLTAWTEYDHSSTTASSSSTTSLQRKDYLDVTLATLLSDSLQRLESLNILPSSPSSETGAEEEEDDDPEQDLQSPVARTIASAPDFGAQGGLVKEGASIVPETHIRTDENSSPAVYTRKGQTSSLHKLSGRGVPYFEDLVSDSRLGRIKRRGGGGLSGDGSVRVKWEIVEIGDWDEDEEMKEAGEQVAGVKRARQDS